MESQRVRHDWSDLARTHREEAGCVPGSRLRRGRPGLDLMSEPWSRAWYSETWVAGREQGPRAPRSPWNRKQSRARLCGPPSRGPVGALSGCREQRCSFSFALEPKCPPELPAGLRKWFVGSWHKGTAWTPRQCQNFSGLELRAGWTCLRQGHSFYPGHILG